MRLSKSIKSLIIKELKCSECGQVSKIWRRRCKNRATGHVKDLYCIKCKETTAHVELKKECKI